MTNKIYNDGNGTVYSHTKAGRLKTRAWARGVTTTYETNALGDTIQITYLLRT